MCQNKMLSDIHGFSHNPHKTIIPYFIEETEAQRSTCELLKVTLSVNV